ncbi:SMI1/KNR4 family protein [Paenibacillus sp. FSL R7-0272]|uniref:SMI1/KNR4 family protein n=1 Tax=Paenibacillus sp. FSL R7-0272 TaxID=2921679 RepID=UPI0030DC34D3
MYIVSHMLKPVSHQELQQVEQEHAVRLPLAYQRWLQQYGEGTYSGWMNIQRPDPEVLKPFAEYDLWEHTEATVISQSQLQECISIGSSVDGDFLVIHADVEGLIWLPRHDEQITVWPSKEASFADILDHIYCGYYHRDEPFRPAYFEPWNEERQHIFYHFTGKENGILMKELADLCESHFSWDLVIDNEYTCKLFSAMIGGYVRFNMASEREIVLFYEKNNHATEAQEAQQQVQAIQQFLQAHHCTALE